MSVPVKEGRPGRQVMQVPRVTSRLLMREPSWVPLYRTLQIRLLMLSFVVLLSQPLVMFAQGGHGNHLPGAGFSADVVGIIAESIPLDDSILAAAPGELGLSFNRHVRLVKLVLHDNRHDWVDIGFRYNPSPDHQFSLRIPSLRESDYYTASWAILDEQDRLVRGSFSFAFGTNREAPSNVMERERLLLEAGSVIPGIIRMQELGAQPAEIRFSDREQPPFEQPFAPVLGQPPQQ